MFFIVCFNIFVSCRLCRKDLSEYKNNLSDNTTPTPIPEPMTLSLVGMGLVGMAFLKRK